MNSKKAFITTHFPGFVNQRRYIEQLVDSLGLGDKELRLIIHLYASVIKCPREYRFGYVPIPYELLRSELGRDLNTKALLDAHVIQCTGFSKEYHRCRRWRLHINIFTGLTEIALQECETSEPINLITGQVLIRPSHELYDDSRHNLPEQVTQCIESHALIKIDMHSLRSYIKSKEDKLEELEQKYGKESTEYQSFLYFVLAVRCNYLIFRSYRPVYTEPGYAVIKPAFRMQESGRLTSILGLIQNWPIEMTAAALASVPNIYNYDLKSSQANGTIQQLKLAGLSCPFLENYRDDPTAKYKLAQAIFDYEQSYVDNWDLFDIRKERAVSLAKNILCSILMGAEVSEKMTPQAVHKMMKFCETDTSDATPGPMRYLYEYLKQEGQLDKAHFAYRRMIQYLQPLIHVMKQWHEWLVKVWLPANKKLSKTGWYVKNAYGCIMYIEKFKTAKPKRTNKKERYTPGDKLAPGEKLKARALKCKLAAHILQGQEALYISHITTLSAEYGYKVSMNMHDGVICQGEIPKEAQERAAQITGTENAELISKPFASPFAQVNKPELNKTEPEQVITIEQVFEPFEYDEESPLIEAIKLQCCGIFKDPIYPELNKELIKRPPPT